MLTRILSFGWLLIVALSLQPVSAQTLYKSIMPDGRIIYGDRPEPDAAKVESTKPDTSKAGVQTSTPREAAAVKQMEQERLKREGAQDDVRAAEKALRDAEAALAAGKEPLASERIGTAGGASRLNDDYWKRQRSLEEAVETARGNLARVRGGSSR